MFSKKKKYDTLSILGLVLMSLGVITSDFSPKISLVLLVSFFILGYFILKRQGKHLKPKEYFLICLFMFSGMLFVILSENLENIFKTENRLIALLLSLTPSIIYFIVDKKAKKSLSN